MLRTLWNALERLSEANPKLYTLVWAAATVLFIILSSLAVASLARLLARLFKKDRLYQQRTFGGYLFASPWIVGFLLWAVVAECRLGRGDRAMEIYDAMLPYNQNDVIEVRQAEPYSYCQFVVGRDHTAFGRARHPWLTGSSGWFYTAATRWMLGVRPGFEGLVVDPCIPAAWKEFEVTRRWRGATYHITVKNPDGVQRGVRAVMMDGRPVEGPIPPQQPGSLHQVVAVMG